jgi:predicted CoA-binding protein
MSNVPEFRTAVPNQSADQQAIDRILRESHVVAVVGLSDDPDRPSFEVAEYLQARGYRIIPVNPNASEILGERTYPDLQKIPDKVDVVGIFRRAEEVPSVVEQAIRIGAKAVWMQEGIVNEEAARQARAAGLLVIMDRCMRKETKRLIDTGSLPASAPSIQPA